MTYAYLGPNGRGRWQIGGNFVDLEAHLLAKYYDPVPPQDRPPYSSKASFIDDNFYQLADKGHGIREDDLPADFKLTNTPKAYGDLIRVKQGIHLVSAAFRACVEQFEPDIHQFWSVRMLSPRGKLVDQEVYGFVIRQNVDAFDEDATAREHFHIGELPHRTVAPALLMKQNMAHFVLKRAAIEGLHLWKDRRIFGAPMFFSDVLYDEIKRQELDIAKVVYING